MAAAEEEHEEVMIAVFSVLKKGSILKNIFLNCPPKPPMADDCLEQGEERSSVANDNDDDLIQVGRHPDCHVVVDHPSISRFHLEIRLSPSLRKITVADRSSVHGTWISGARIVPNVPVALVDGDILRLGASTRVYRLQWVSQIRAIEMENPLAPLIEEKEENFQGDSDQLVNEMREFRTSEIPSAPPLIEMMKSSSPLPSEMEQQSPARLAEESLSFCSAAQMLVEFVGSLMLEPEENQKAEISCALEKQSERQYSSPVRFEKKEVPSSLLSRRSKSKSVSSLRIHTGRSKERFRSTRVDTEVEGVIENENGVAHVPVQREETICRVLFENMNEKDDFKEEHFESDKENVTPMSVHQKLKSSSTVLQERIGSVRADTKVGAGVGKENNVACLQTQRVEKMFKVIFENLGEKDENKGELFQSVSQKVKNCSAVLQESLLVSAAKSVEKNLTDLVKENCTIDVPRDLMSNEVKFKSHARRFKENFKSCSGDENFPLASDQKLMIGQKDLQLSCSKTIITSNVVEELFHSEKENLTPESCKDMRHWRLFSQSLSNAGDKEELFSSGKENQKPQVSGSAKSNESFNGSRARIEREIMKRRVERIPFQPLLENSPLGSNNLVDHALNNISDSNCTSFNNGQKVIYELNHSSRLFKGEVSSKAAEERKTWNIVVDTDCLLDEDSRRSLQLLEGLKGTHLIIPRMVIRELDCLKRRESFFRKSTKKAASSVLQWIEECMVKTAWWIHVQSSFEIMPIAPTPPVSPRSPFSDATNDLGGNSMAFSTHGSLMQIVSPTADDHILDCALLFKKIKSDGELVLLSNSITLKIKAMAEGLLCESPLEFRKSLVNPFSKRFLWVDSSPRGSTWSCSDEVGLSENCNYYQRPTCRDVGKAAEAAKGLKLILLHNSHYGQPNLVK